MALSLCVAGHGHPVRPSLGPGTAGAFMPLSLTQTRRSCRYGLRALRSSPRAILDAGHDVADLAQASWSGVSSLAPALHTALTAVGDAGSQLSSHSSSIHEANSLALLAELSPQDAGLLATILGPVLAVVNLLFIFRIVMSWYPQLPVKDLPFSIAYFPTEPLLDLTRRVVPPVGGVDVAPVIWLAFFSFINEILLGQQGLLILISQQQI